MKNLICVMAGIIALPACADSFSPQDIRERFEVRADIYSVDDSGKKILSGPERSNYWRMDPETGELKSNWSSSFGDGLFVGVNANFKVTGAGTIEVQVAEYKGKGDKEESKPDEILQKKEFVLENLEPITLKVKGTTSKHYIVRIVPSLREISRPISVDSLPVAGSGISVFDSDGFIWAENYECNGKYTGLTSHRGTLALSYVPFPGGKDIGVAEGNQIIVRPGKKFTITLKSANAFLPVGVTARVYAAYLPEKKTQNFRSLHSFDTSKVERLEEKLK